jgi:pyruvate dehydrogenase E2 component (dihydrolipoamide acetyltransferase)
MIELRLPSFGADMEDALFVAWHARPGQALRKGEVACVVETQEGAIDVELWQDGTLAACIAEPGQRLPVGAPLALLAEAGEDWQAVAAQHAAAPRPPAPDAVASPAPSPAPSAEPATPPPPAPSTAAPGAPSPASSAAASTTPPATAPTAPAPGHAPQQPPAAAPPARDAQATSPMREAIGAAMARSKREIPHYYLAHEIRVDAALNWLEKLNASRPPAERVLFAALALRAVAQAAAVVPGLNGHWIDGGVRSADRVHLGVVTALRGGGLVVPALHDADRLDLPATMAALSQAIARARGGRLRSGDLGDATLTVSNLGDLGCDEGWGVIYPPQLAIVGLGRIAPRPVVTPEGSLAAARTLRLTLAADHRASDGLVGARFIGAVAHRLEHPELT